MADYQGACNDCTWEGPTQHDIVAARFDARQHDGDYKHDNVEVRGPRPDGHPDGPGGVFVYWTPRDGRGEDGRSYM